jgi:putative nucleotidyltransferase with HDIG domain
MKVGERVVGVISIESEQADAFSAADERLIATLANQAASAFENARLFEEERQRVAELETINRISSAMRTASKPGEMLSIVLDEALSILNTSHGAIELYNKTTAKFEKTVTRGWVTQVKEPPQGVDEGIVGWVFTNGQNHISREFLSDPLTRQVARGQVPPGWGGIFLPIWSDQQTLGVLSVAVPSERELSADEIRLLSTLSEMTGTALQRMQLHEQTIRHLEQLNALRTVDQAISSSRDMRLTLSIILTHAVSQLSVDAVDVLLFGDNSSILRPAASHGFYTSLLDSVDLNSFAGRSVLEHRLIAIPNIEVASQNPRFAKFWKEEGFVCYWCVPLIVKGEVKGVLEVYRRSVFVPDTEWLEFFETLAGQTAIAVDSASLFEYLQRANLDLRLAYDATIEGWSRAMDLRDRETEGHTLRVTDLTVKLARLMNVSESQLTAVRRGALLHDIGKMGVPDSILLKDGKLTKEEWEVMRKHPQFAYEMLAPIGYLNDALDIPYSHHEKWDGTGYPQGLKGVNIPLSARIFAVVDVWDALTNDRSYRKKWTEKKAQKYIKEQSGKHFDPQIVDIFLKNIESKDF